MEVCGFEGLKGLTCYYLVNSVGSWRRKKGVCGIEFYLQSMERRVALLEGDSFLQRDGIIYLVFEVEWVWE